VSLRVAVRAADNSVKFVDTGVTAGQSSLVPGLLPMGGAAGDTAYVLNFQDQPKAEAANAAGTTPLAFVDKPNYGLAVWPGQGAAGPRLAWATTPGGQAPLVTSLVMAAPDGSGLTTLVTETVQAGQPPYQLVAERWSPDGQSLYYSREPYGIGGYIPFAAASSLFRYNLADKSVTELIPFTPSGGKMLCLDDLLPDASLAVGHCGADVKTIVVHPIGGGADQTITPPASVTGYNLVGGARFSPDGKRVAFAMAAADPSAEQGWVAVSDGLSGSSTLVTKSAAGTYFVVVGWLNANTLLIENNVLNCNPDCVNSVWSVNLDGTHLTKLIDGTFLALVGAQ
jgi:hypothetical protein